MTRDIDSHIVTLRLSGLPEALRRKLRGARRDRGWSQVELGRRVGLPQAHISGIETGKIVPRFDTLLEVARTLDFDLVAVPRALVPAVQALIRDSLRGETRDGSDGEQPLYATDDFEDEPEAESEDESDEEVDEEVDERPG